MLKPNATPFSENVSSHQIAKPLNLSVPSQSERLLNLIRLEQLRAAQHAEVETFEEADDFEMEDEEWFSPYEEVFEPPSDPVPPDAPVAAPAATVTPPVASDTGGES